MSPEMIQNQLKRLEEIQVRMEKKLDTYLEQTIQNKNDIKWIRGFVKISVTTLFSGVAGLVILLFKAKIV